MADQTPGKSSRPLPAATDVEAVSSIDITWLGTPDLK